jgi:hypothetical protein
MYTCGQVWGGSGFLLIPHQNGQVSRQLRRLVRAYYPDYVVTLPMTIGQFDAMNPDAPRWTSSGRLVEGCRARSTD